MCVAFDCAAIYAGGTPTRLKLPWAMMGESLNLDPPQDSQCLSGGTEALGMCSGSEQQGHIKRPVFSPEKIHNQEL
jgi:hypothetical protein